MPPKTFIRLDNLEEVSAYTWDLLYGPNCSNPKVSTRHLRKILGKQAVDDSISKGEVPYLATSPKWAVRLVETTSIEARAAQVAYLILRDRDDNGNVECFYCPKLLDMRDSAKYEVEHIINRSIGGPSNGDNLALVCPECNRLMGHLSAVEKVREAIRRRMK